eukprot:CAMPEP_0182416562 /NCGR_PEP_ID=MMETSP1167-20130531/903_1 /TAXON_ID=2988 /ORGANISM="Mallomonas Sp, Strain CCMP3275" /LENGTH=782 /DNA_ID=CAMNT_0024589451 /DNA_START=300 /DNA_END=2648 /DNA_ORIENTATION=-
MLDKSNNFTTILDNDTSSLVEEYHNRANKLEQELGDLKNMNTMMTEFLRQKDDELSQERLNMDQIKAQLVDKESAYDTLFAHHDILDSKHSDVSRKVSELSGQLLELHSEVTRLSSELKAVKNEKEGQEKYLKSKVRELEDENMSIQTIWMSAVNETEQEKEKLVLEMKSLTDEIEELQMRQAQYDELGLEMDLTPPERRMKGDEMRVERMTSKQSRGGDSSQVLTLRSHSMGALGDAEDIDCLDELEAAQRSVRVLESANQKLWDSVKSREQELSRLRAHLDRTSVQLSEEEMSHDALLGTHRELVSRHHEATLHVSEQEFHIITLESEMIQLTEKWTDCRREWEEKETLLLQEIDRVREELTLVRAQLVEKTVHLKALEEEIMTKQSTWASTLIQSEEEREELSRTLHEKEMEEEKNRELNNMSKLQEEVNQLSTILKEVREEREESERERKRVVRELDEEMMVKQSLWATLFSEVEMERETLIREVQRRDALITNERAELTTAIALLAYQSGLDVGIIGDKWDQMFRELKRCTGEREKEREREMRERERAGMMKEDMRRERERERSDMEKEDIRRERERGEEADESLYFSCREGEREREKEVIRCSQEEESEQSDWWEDMSTKGSQGEEEERERGRDSMSDTGSATPPSMPWDTGVGVEVGDSHDEKREREEKTKRERELERENELLQSQIVSLKRMRGRLQETEKQLQELRTRNCYLESYLLGHSGLTTLTAMSGRRSSWREKKIDRLEREREKERREGDVSDDSSPENREVSECRQS